jgi:hypothetical protein
MCHVSLIRVSDLGEATVNHLEYPIGGFAGLKHQHLQHLRATALRLAIELEPRG